MRRPVWLYRIRVPGAEAFAMLFALESFSRALVVSLIPVEALRLTGDTQRVSVLLFVVSLTGLGATLTAPLVARRVPRRWLYTLGVLLLVSAPLAMGAGGVVHFAVGLALRIGAVVLLTYCLSLYILDHVARSDYSRAEPMRIFYAAGPWVVGPALGAWLAASVGLWAAYGAASLSALALLGYFWYLRLRDERVLMAGQPSSPSPIANVGRYFRRPRLVFAWVQSVGRYVWWVMFFIYLPIYAVQSGLGQVMAGVLVSAGSALLLLLPLAARWMRRHGTRALLVTGFSVSGVLTIVAAAFADWPWLTCGAILLAGFAMVALDAVGNTPFMFAVRRHERRDMTAVYATYRDAGEIGAPGLFALVLKVFALPAVFVTTGVVMLALAGLSRRVHPRLGRARPARLRTFTAKPPPRPAAEVSLEPRVRRAG